MNEKLRRRLSDFEWDSILTKMRINDAIISTYIEISELLECGIISCDEFDRLGRELCMET